MYAIRSYYAKYNFGSFALIGQYENDNDADVSAWALVAEAYFGNNTLRALYGTIDTDVERNNFV